MKFSEWIWDKFHQWRGKSLQSATAFAKYLGVSRQSLLAWMDGKYVPQDEKNISKLAFRYPDIYDILKLDRPVIIQDQLAQLPEPARSATREALAAIHKRGVTEDSDEALLITIAVFEKYGFKYYPPPK